MEPLLVVICFVLALIVIVLLVTRKQPSININSNETKFNSDFIYKDKDDGFDGFDEVTFLRNKNLPFLTIKFDYVNSNDENSERTVGVNKIFKSTKFEDEYYYIRGFCHLKVAYRTFRLDRMSNLKNVDNGKVYDNPEEFISEYKD
jgi:hypothetical protein